jgi:hypothetical protein
LWFKIDVNVQPATRVDLELSEASF